MYTIIGGDGQEYGPVSPTQIRQWIAAGRVNAQTRAKAFGTEEWRAISDFPEFAPAAAQPPRLDGIEPEPGGFVPAVPLASRLRRLVAQIIDGVCSGLCALPMIAAIPLSTFLTAVENYDLKTLLAVSGSVFAILAMAVLLVVQIVLLATRGQTIGKLVMSVRIVQFPDGERVGLVKSFLLRMCLMGLIEAIPYIGSLISLIDVFLIFRADRRCLHDHLAGTMVVSAA